MNKIIDLYLSRKDVPTRFDVVQGSQAPGITFVLRDYEPNNGATARIFIKKKESEVYNTCTLSGNEVTYNPTVTSFDEPGKCTGQLEIVSGGKIAVSYRLYINVEPNIIDSSAIEATDDFSALQDAILAVGDISEYKEQTETNTADITAIEAITDKISIQNNISEMAFNFAAAGNPYLRWKVNDAYYQFLIGPTNLVYEKYENGAWSNIYRIYSSTYLPGETVDFTGSKRLQCAGCITNGSKDCHFLIPLPRSTTGRTINISFNSSNGFSGRLSTGGYMDGTQYVDVNQSGWTIITETNPAGVLVIVRKDTAITGVTNNTPITVEVRGTITFS